MSSMFKFPIPSEAEPRCLEWLVCPDCQVWCHYSTGLGRVGAAPPLPAPAPTWRPLHPSPHCTLALVQRGHHRDTEVRAARPLLARQWWRGGEGGQVCAHCVVAAGAQVTFLQLTLTLAQQNWSCRCSAPR